MATTLEKIREFLDRSKLKYDVHEELDAISLGFSFDGDGTTYRDPDGDPFLQLVIRLSEKGEHVAVFAPYGWNLADCEHRGAVCEAVAIMQSEMKLIRFDLHTNDELIMLVPNIELPLESSPLCRRQLHRAVRGVVHAVRRFDAVLRHAMATGEVDLTLARDDVRPAPPPELTDIINFGEIAGGLDALEGLLGSSDAPPIEPIEP